MSGKCIAGYELPDMDEPCPHCGAGPGDRCGEVEKKELEEMRQGHRKFSLKTADRKQEG